MENLKYEFTKLEPDTLVEELVKFMEVQLPFFWGSQTYNKIMVIYNNESQHSAALVTFMNKLQDKFTFINEVPQKGSRKIDIGIMLKADDELIYTIEAKVLPIPSTSKRGESEYVYAKDGDNGAGIERFKKGFHGLDWNQNPLPKNGMIAYVKEEDFQTWVTKINQWVLDAKWNKSEQLISTYFTPIGKLESNHKRDDGSTLLLHHFWVSVK
jgi:hypothetical protein